VGASWEVGPLAPGETAELMIQFDGYTEPEEVTWIVVIDPDQETNDPDFLNNSGWETIQLSP
jgi:hypothetical protein